MKAFEGCFKKVNGTIREMIFIELSELPQSFLNSLISNSNVSKTYAEGMRLVFDLEYNGLRIFNFKTQIGSLREIQVPESYLE